MEISRMNGISNAVQDKTFDLPTRKAAPTESGASAGTSGSAVTPLDVFRLENDLGDQEGDTTTEEFLSRLIEKVNVRLSGGNRTFDYSRHKKTGQLMIKIVDRETKEVVREIPPEKTLDAVARMWDMMGIFVDNKT